MEHLLNEEQRLLQESADRFVRDAYGFEARQALVRSPDGFGRDNWRRFAELGWLGVAVPENMGGIGGGTAELALLMEAFGKGLVVEPFLATVVLCGDLLARCGGEEPNALLQEMMAGERLMALAHAEPQSRHCLSDVASTATASGGGFRLDGTKSLVFGGDAADTLIVTARTGEGRFSEAGISLFLVDPALPGVARRGFRTQDGQRAAEVIFEDVAVGYEAMLGQLDSAFHLIEAAIDRATVLLCAEAAGAMEAAVAMTGEYLKTREQFGRPIGDFQVLQHRLVEMYMAHQMTRALVFRAAAVRRLSPSSIASHAAAAVKAQTGKAARLVGQEAVQLHGGMGMTDEMAVGHYFKRLTMIDALYGNAAYHLSRFAEEAGT